MEAQRTVAVVLLGAPGSGKTALAEALLAAAGAAPARGSGLARGSYDSRGVRVVLLDPPGDPDLAGQLHAGLRVADAVVLVVSPVQGVDARTVALWESLEHLPRLVVLSQLDRPGADADEAVAVCQRVLGEGVLPLQLPLHDDDGSVGGLLDLLHLRVTEGSQTRAAEAEHLPLVATLRAELVEALLTGSDDQALFEAYLDDQEPLPAVLDHELAGAVGRGDLQPVLVAVPRRGVGLTDLLALLASALPSGRAPLPAATGPGGEPVELAAEGPLVAEVVTVGLWRVWSGSLTPGTSLIVANQPMTYDGPAVPCGALVEVDLSGAPGDVVTAAAVEPSDVGVGDAVGSGETGALLRLSPWPMPTAAFPVGAPADTGLAHRVHADPVARLETDPVTGQLLLWTYGPGHAEALLGGLPSAPVRVAAGSRPVAVRIRIPGWAERSVRSDLGGRGGEVLAASADEHGVTLSAALPPAEAVGYALALARASADTGTVERT